MKKIEYLFVGKHMIADLYELSPKIVFNERLLKKTLIESIKFAGANFEGILTKRYNPYGFSAVIILSESHASIHSYPEKNSIFMDVFTCGENCNPEKAFEYFVSKLNVKKYKMKLIERGGEYGKGQIS